MLPHLSGHISWVSQIFHGASRLQTFRVFIVLCVSSLSHVSIFICLTVINFLILRFLYIRLPLGHRCVYAWCYNCICVSPTVKLWTQSFRHKHILCLASFIILLPASRGKKMLHGAYVLQILCMTYWNVEEKLWKVLRFSFFVILNTLVAYCWTFSIAHSFCNWWYPRGLSK